MSLGTEKTANIKLNRILNVVKTKTADERKNSATDTCNNKYYLLNFTLLAQKLHAANVYGLSLH